MTDLHLFLYIRAYTNYQSHGTHVVLICVLSFSSVGPRLYICLSVTLSCQTEFKICTGGLAIAVLFCTLAMSPITLYCMYCTVLFVANKVFSSSSRVASSCGICCRYQKQGPRFNVKILSCKCGQLHVPSLSISMVTDCQHRAPFQFKMAFILYCRYGQLHVKGKTVDRSSFL